MLAKNRLSLMEVILSATVILKLYTFGHTAALDLL